MVLRSKSRSKCRADSLDYWGSRLQKYGARVNPIETRFGDRTLSLVDPHGMRLALVEPGRPTGRSFAPWEQSPIEPERQVRGLYGAQLWERSLAPTTGFLTSVLGFKKIGEENGWTRYGFDNATGVLDIREAADARRGAWGVGSVHHLAWRVDDEAHQLAIRGQVESGGRQPTPVIDRFWFKSVYFQEPGGVLFELATDGPGFAVDEDRAHLGETLVLPPWLEPSRSRIEVGTASAQARGLRPVDGALATGPWPLIATLFPPAQTIEERFDFVLRAVANRALEGGCDVDEHRRRRHGAGDARRQHDAIALARETVKIAASLRAQLRATA